MASPHTVMSTMPVKDAFTQALDERLRRSSGQSDRRNSRDQLQGPANLPASSPSLDAPTPMNTFAPNGQTQAMCGLGSPTTFNYGVTARLAALQTGLHGQPVFNRRGSVGGGNGSLLSPSNLMGRVPQNTPASFIDIVKIARSMTLQDSIRGLQVEDGTKSPSGLPAPPLSPTERRPGHAINSSPLRRFAEGKREPATHLGSFSGLPKQTRLTCTRSAEGIEAIEKQEKGGEAPKVQDVFGK